jgi:hypothetical protein
LVIKHEFALNGGSDFKTPKMMWTNFLIAAPTMAIFGFPAFANRFFMSMTIGLNLSATNAGMKNALRKRDRPIFDIIPRAAREVPDCLTLGATPMKAANALAFLN